LPAEIAVRIWITGSRGFVGRHACRAAVRAGHRVIAIDVRAEPGASDLLPEGSGVELACDLDAPEAVLALAASEPPEAVLHLAWYTAPQDYLRSDRNVGSLRTTLAFASTLAELGCPRLVGAGTCLEYADLPRPRTETDATDPDSLYARCKHAAHVVLEELARQRGTSLVWARVFHMHGPGEHPKRLIPAVIDALRAGRPFSLSAGDQLRDHLDVRDVAGALVHLAASKADGIVNVCSGKSVALRTVLEKVGDAVGRPELLRFGERPYQPGEIMNLTGDPARLVASGFVPEHGDLDKSLAEQVRELQ
jgi:dTDP-6-deoxy-L-talose 4-dehydrogenase (NAD+)